MRMRDVLNPKADGEIALLERDNCSVFTGRKREFI